MRWDPRLPALAAVAALTGLIRWLASDSAQREAWTLLLALPLGYGHLVGGVVARRRPRGAMRGALGWDRVALASGWLSVFALYTHLLQDPWLRPWVTAPLLALSAWHILENDRALGRAHRAGRLRLDGSPPSAGDRLCVIAGSLALLAAGLATPAGRQWSLLVAGTALPVSLHLGVAELASAVLLYHAFSWLGFVGRRAVRTPGPEGRRLRRVLLASHALPLVANALLYAWADALHAFVASPALYLFWSALHAAQTRRARRGPR